MIRGFFFRMGRMGVFRRYFRYGSFVGDRFVLIEFRYLYVLRSVKL